MTSQPNNTTFDETWLPIIKAQAGPETGKKPAKINLHYFMGLPLVYLHQNAHKYGHSINHEQ